MRIAVTGALGFLGKHLTEHLTKLGHEVTGIALRHPPSPSRGVKYLTLASLDSKERHKIPPFDAIVNLAARRSTRENPYSNSEVHKFTFEIPRNFIERFSSKKSIIINTSTYIQNFEGIEGRTVESYGKAKQELSDFLREFADNSEIKLLDLYLFTVYGNGDKPSHLIPSLIRAAQTGIPVPLSPGEQLINLLNVEDVVKNISRALDFQEGVGYQKHYVWDTDYLTVRNLVSTMNRIFDVEIDCLWGARPYAGHEMFAPWETPMDLLPGFSKEIDLAAGLTDLWNRENLYTK